MKILLVDDEPALRELLRATFEGADVSVDEAESGLEAEARIRRRRPDVIVLDQMMPGLTGVETARRLRESGFDKPIVLFSAYVGPDLQTAVKELDLEPVSKVDTQAVIRIVERLGGALA